VEEDGAHQVWLEKQKTFAEVSGQPKTLKADYVPASK